MTISRSIRSPLDDVDHAGREAREGDESADDEHHAAADDHGARAHCLHQWTSPGGDDGDHPDEGDRAGAQAQSAR